MLPPAADIKYFAPTTVGGFLDDFFIVILYRSKAIRTKKTSDSLLASPKRAYIRPRPF